MMGEKAAGKEKCCRGLTLQTDPARGILKRERGPETEKEREEKDRQTGR